MKPIGIIVCFALLVFPAAAQYPFAITNQSNIQSVTFLPVELLNADLGYDVRFSVVAQSAGQAVLTLGLAASVPTSEAVRIHSLRVSFSGPPGAYLTFSLFDPDPATSGHIERVALARYDGQPVIASFINVGQLGKPAYPCNEFSNFECGFSFAGYGSLVVRRLSAIPGMTGDVVTRIESTGFPGGGLGNIGDVESIIIEGSLLTDMEFGGTVAGPLQVFRDVGSPTTAPQISARNFRQVDVGNAQFPGTFYGRLVTIDSGTDSLKRMSIFGNLVGTVEAGE